MAIPDPGVFQPKIVEKSTNRLLLAKVVIILLIVPMAFVMIHRLRRSAETPRPRHEQRLVQLKALLKTGDKLFTECTNNYPELVAHYFSQITSQYTNQYVKIPLPLIEYTIDETSLGGQKRTWRLVVDNPDVALTNINLRAVIIRNLTHSSAGSYRSLTSDGRTIEGGSADASSCKVRVFDVASKALILLTTFDAPPPETIVVQDGPGGRVTSPRDGNIAVFKEYDEWLRGLLGSEAHFITPETVPAQP